jgi:hypothetical protein
MNLTAALGDYSRNHKPDERMVYTSEAGIIHKNLKGDVVWTITGEVLELSVKNITENWRSLIKQPKEKVLEFVMKGRTAIVFSEGSDTPTFFKGGGTTDQGKPKFYSSRDLSQWEPESNIPVTDIVFGVWYLIN